MKALLLSQFIPPTVGGTERHVWTLATALTGRGHEVTLMGFVGDGPATEEMCDGVRVLRVRTAASHLPMLYSDTARPHALPIPDPMVSRAIRKVLSEGNFDVVHAHNWIVNSALGPAARAGVPLVMTLHEYSHVCPTVRYMDHGKQLCTGPSPKRCLSCASDHYGPLRGLVTVAANSWSAKRRAAHIVDVAAVSSAVANAVAVPADGWLGNARLNAAVVPNFIPDHLVLEKIPPITGDAPLLYVGALNADKGIAPLLDAYSRLDSPPPLILAGRSDGSETWRLPVGVQMMGALPYDDVQRLYRSARVVVVPSVWGDPCPTVVMEAMAAGRPVVAAASGGIVDMVVDGETGYLTPPGDSVALASALDKIIRAPREAASMGLAGRDRVRQFTVSAVVERIEQMYLSAISTVTPGSAELITSATDPQSRDRRRVPSAP